MNTNDKNDETVKAVKWLKYALSIALVSALSLICLYLFTFSGGLSQDNDKWGTFGDFLGGTINPILGFLSFIALITTIRLQLQELSQTREELKRSADAQSASEIHLKKQTLALEEQQFENSFYSLLTHHNTTLREISKPNNRYVDQKSNIELLYSSVTQSKDANHAFLQIKNADEILSNYFNVLLVTLHFIDKKNTNIRISEIVFSQWNTPRKPRSLYAGIVKSFITPKLLYLVAIYCCNPHNVQAKALHTLVEKYGIVSGLDMDLTEVSKEIKTLLPKNFPAKD